MRTNFDPILTLQEIQIRQILANLDIRPLFRKKIIFSWCHQERHLDLGAFTYDVRFYRQVGRSKIPQNRLTSYVNAPFKGSQSTKVERKNKLSNFLLSRYHGSPINFGHTCDKVFDVIISVFMQSSCICSRLRHVIWALYGEKLKKRNILNAKKHVDQSSNLS